MTIEKMSTFIKSGGVRELGAEKNIWTQNGWSYGKGKKVKLSLCLTN
jgi:hypothetical protein